MNLRIISTLILTLLVMTLFAGCTGLMETSDLNETHNKTVNSGQSVSNESIKETTTSVKPTSTTKKTISQQSSTDEKAGETYYIV